MAASAFQAEVGELSTKQPVCLSVFLMFCSRFHFQPCSNGSAPPLKFHHKRGGISLTLENE